MRYARVNDGEEGMEKLVQAEGEEERDGRGRE